MTFLLPPGIKGLKHDTATIYLYMGRAFKISLGSLGWKWGLVTVNTLFSPKKVRNFCGGVIYDKAPG